jgi:hypothetical protein
MRSPFITLAAQSTLAIPTRPRGQRGRGTMTPNGPVGAREARATRFDTRGGFEGRSAAVRCHDREGQN